MYPDKLITLLLNLDGSDVRLATMRKSLADAGMEWQRVLAVDGRNRTPESFLNYNARKCRRRIGRSLNGGELGCYGSHLLALKAFVKSDASFALILEDDADLPPNTAKLLDEILRYLEQYHPLAWDVVNLTGKRDNHFRVATQLSEGVLRQSFYFPILATAFLWSRQGAIAFLASEYGSGIAGPYDAEVRSFCNMRGRGFSLDEPPIPPLGVASDIDGGSEMREQMSGNRRKSSLKTKFFRHLPDKLRAKKNLLLSTIGGHGA